MALTARAGGLGACVPGCRAGTSQALIRATQRASKGFSGRFGVRRGMAGRRLTGRGQWPQTRARPHSPLR